MQFTERKNRKDPGFDVAFRYQDEELEARYKAYKNEKDIKNNVPVNVLRSQKSMTYAEK